MGRRYDIEALAEKPDVATTVWSVLGFAGPALLAVALFALYMLVVKPELEVAEAIEGHAAQLEELKAQGDGIAAQLK